MSIIRDDNFYTVLGWMLNVLNLKGNELIVFAIIYSFSQDGESKFEGSVSYLQQFSNIKSPQTVYVTLSNLEARGYITKSYFYEGKVKRCAYAANLDVIDGMKGGLTAMQPSNSKKPI